MESIFPSWSSVASACVVYPKKRLRPASHPPVSLTSNYFDCAPSYFDGEAEIKLDEALKPYRKRVFLAEKTMRRDAKGAREELELTLRRFHTDYVDNTSDSRPITRLPLSV